VFSGLNASSLCAVIKQVCAINSNIYLYSMGVLKINHNHQTEKHIMKKLLISTIITAGILLAGNAQASNIDSVVESKLVKVCEAIKSDSLIKVNAAVRKSGIAMKQIANSLMCNGNDPVSFALANDAEKTAKYMAKKSHVNFEALVAKL
jgi:hypothetical protein